MFTPTDHPYVGTRRAFIPQGFSPYAPEESVAPLDPSVILPAGDTVTVVSAWSRPYLPPTAPTLLYVRSDRTGQFTHVTAADLPMTESE